MFDISFNSYYQNMSKQDKLVDFILSPTPKKVYFREQSKSENINPNP